MNDRDIEDTRQPPEYDAEVVMCVVCKDDFPEEVMVAIQGYRKEVFGFCQCCVEKINEIADR